MDTLRRPFWRTHLTTIVVGLINVFLIGLGMGVPVLAILFGFGVGWWFAGRPVATPAVEDDPVRIRARGLLTAAAGLAAASLVVLLVVWGTSIGIAFDPDVEAAEWGIPLILYTSQASKIGWLLLMLLVSPALQFMAVVTGGVLRLSRRPGRRTGVR